MTRDEQIAEAARPGRVAFDEDRRRVPAHDPELMRMLEGRYVGRTPEGEADTVEILDAWLASWDRANVAAPVPGVK